MKAWIWFWIGFFACTVLVALTTPACSQEHLRGDKVLLRAVLQEAESETLEGMVAVAGVVMDRAQDPRWPDTAEAVARQPRQFAGMSAPVRNYGERAVTRARAAIAAAQVGYRPCGTVYWFHATYVKPGWDYSKIEFACQIGEHLFYRDKE